MVLGRRGYAIAAAITLFAGNARAQDQAPVEKLVQMNKQALHDYETLEWDSAKKTLLNALLAGKKAGLGNDPVMARTYVNLGALCLTGFKDRDKAFQSFSRALEIDPTIQLARGIATQDMNEMFAKVRQDRGIGVNGEQLPPKKRPPTVLTATEEAEEKHLPVKIQSLDCPNEDEAIIDRPATLRCALARSLTQVSEVFLMYREPNRERFTEQRMTKSPKGWYVGKIPRKAVFGRSVSYYFEGRDAAGKPVIRNGEESSPNILLLMEEDQYKKMKLERGRRDRGDREWDCALP